MGDERAADADGRQQAPRHTALAAQHDRDQAGEQQRHQEPLERPHRCAPVR